MPAEDAVVLQRFYLKEYRDKQIKIIKLAQNGKGYNRKFVLKDRHFEVLGGSKSFRVGYDEIVEVFLRPSSFMDFGNPALGLAGADAPGGSG